MVADSGRIRTAQLLADGRLALLREEDLTDEVVMVIYKNGAWAVARGADGPVVTEGLCPHAKAPLIEGEWSGSTVTCRRHGLRFELATGACQNNPRYRLRRFSTIVVNGYICLGPERPIAPAARMEEVSRWP